MKWIVFISVVFFTSCGPPLYTKKRMGCFEYHKNQQQGGRDTVQKRFFSNYYFVYKDTALSRHSNFKRSKMQHEVKIYSYMDVHCFYESGVYLYFKICCGNEDYATLSTIEEFVSDLSKKKKKEYTNLLRIQGKYEIRNDTIHIKGIFNPYGSLNVDWEAGENWWVIRDSNIVEEIANRWLSYDRTNYPKNYLAPIRYMISPKKYYLYHSSPIIPEKHLWILNKKWFWCDKEQYRAWKKNSRRDK